ncbi:dethiobiotin synthetase [Sulfuritortus calidifontis]|uniref:ATP-dependent dethiobiotin synthetase BioD n=1 Tax=Sulfuritortus calidifontis TaxID=1914471 RepID=A0A4V2UQY9_9PROT|nr:dethiobiotin synthase [Sulfuritortus calidifontis]TCS73396.1 dethiobiotin synthetase [Sulfuritortus calidifontis]
MPGIFVTGTDTGVGKTRVAVALIEALKAQGLRVVGMKPVAAGCDEVAGEWLNEDVARLRAAANVAAPMAWVNPYRFPEPIAPHIAAARQNTRIELAPIVAAYRELERLADCVVVEGAGGFRVPLNEAEDSADLAVALGLPMVLVVGLRLGCLNHALLSAEAIAARGLTLAGWVANGIDPIMALRAENVRALRERIAAPCLAEWPWLEKNAGEVTSAMLDLGPILPRFVRR